MIEKEERAALVKALSRVVKEYVSGIIDGIHGRIKALEDSIKSLPIPECGKRGEAGPVGPQGEHGKDGRDGIDGKDGIDGLNGKDGANGIDGKDGAPGESIKGDKGDPGEKGIDGKDGRDALQIDILPAIDLSKSYPRGTFARYDGGIIRSYRDTIAGEEFDHSGWEIVVAGLADISLSVSDDFRLVSVSARSTGGAMQAKFFTLPAMLYRGIYESGKEYAQGDVVTWGGSAWHCQKATSSAPIDRSEDWKLMVKEGRKGKDGKDGERGLQGLKGDPGRDLTQMTFGGEKY